MREYAANIALSSEAIDRLVARIENAGDDITRAGEALNIDRYVKGGERERELLNRIEEEKTDIIKDIEYLRGHLRKMIIYVHLLTDAAEERKKTL